MRHLPTRDPTQRREPAYRGVPQILRRPRGAVSGFTPALYQPVSKSEWMAAHPSGRLEYREAFGPQGRYGRWLRTKSTVLQLGDTVFMHAGINPERAPRRLDDINKQVASRDQAVRRVSQPDDRSKLILPSFTLSEILTAAQIEVQIAAAHSKSAQAGPPESLDAVTDSGSPQARRTPSDRPWSLLRLPKGRSGFGGFAPLVRGCRRRFR